MKRIGILGDIGSGKSHIAKKFGYPVFNADLEVAKLYKKDKIIFKKLKKILPKYLNNFPVKKEQITNAILDNKQNLKK
jgi:dephospho-CoA kinase